jgi:8-oxo-dGTP pyrophosphatase MutT (NUDIX family)
MRAAGAILSAVSRIVEQVRRRLAARTPGRGPSELRAAAVLIPILLKGDAESESLLLTQRSRTLRRQPGDIAFPGGAVDSDDATPLATALRESHEEVGLSPDAVTLVGQMDERGTVTGFRITPFVATIDASYPFRTNEEVESLIEVPIASLKDPTILEVETRRFPDGSMRSVYHYHYDGHDIWGITGRLIKEFLDLIG